MHQPMLVYVLEYLSVEFIYGIVYFLFKFVF